MKYSDKREFAARVFKAVLERYSYVAGHDDDCDKAAVLLAQAQLEALPGEAWSNLCDEYGPKDYDAAPYCDEFDAAYALAVKLAPLVGVEVQDEVS